MTIRFTSGIPSLDALRFMPFPSRPITTDKIVRINSHVFALKGTTVYVSGDFRITGGFMRAVDLAHDRFHYLADGVVRLGLVNGAEVAKLTEQLQRAKKARKTRDALRYFSEYAKDAGIKLTTVQQRRVNMALDASKALDGHGE